jgi:hypothetical protein
VAAGSFPEGGDEIVAGMTGLLSGHPGRGLPPDLAARLPRSVAVYGCVGAGEVLAVAAAAFAAVLVARYRRPGDARRGMATRYEAAQVLGIGRLRTARPVIRPDLDGLRARCRPASTPAIPKPVDGHDDRSTR